MTRDKLERENEKRDEVTSHHMDDDRLEGRDNQAHARGEEGNEDLLNSGSTMTGDRGKMADLSDTPGEGKRRD